MDASDIKAAKASLVDEYKRAMDEAARLTRTGSVGAAPTNAGSALKHPILNISKLPPLGPGPLSPGAIVHMGMPVSHVPVGTPVIQCPQCGCINVLTPGPVAQCGNCGHQTALPFAPQPGPLFSDKDIERIAQYMADEVCKRLGTMLTNTLLLKAGFDETLRGTRHAGGSAGEGTGVNGGSAEG